MAGFIRDNHLTFLQTDLDSGILPHSRHTGERRYPVRFVIPANAGIQSASSYRRMPVSSLQGRRKSILGSGLRRNDARYTANGLYFA